MPLGACVAGKAQRACFWRGERRSRGDPSHSAAKKNQEKSVGEKIGKNCRQHYNIVRIGPRPRRAELEAAQPESGILEKRIWAIMSLSAKAVEGDPGARAGREAVRKLFAQAGYQKS
jgi:hypothetical protein